MSLRPQSDEIFIVGADANLRDPPLTLDEKRERLTAARQLIQAKFDAGIPLFTKDLFRDVVRQFESDDNLDRKVSVTGLDGVSVDFSLKTGTKHAPHPYGDNYVCIIAKPILEYESIDGLLSIHHQEFNPACLAYLPVKIAHSTEVRNAQTNEFVYLWPTPDCATIRQRFEQAKRSFEASECFAQLKSTLDSVAVLPRINKVVALACSSITWDHDPPMSSMAQHALALTIRDYLDPIYTPLDEQVLCEAGFTVVDDPRAFLEVDEASLVISMSPDIPVRQITADIARPAVMIWDKVVVLDRGILWTDQVSPRVEQMMEEYMELPFPAEPKLFDDVAIYIRKGA